MTLIEMKTSFLFAAVDPGEPIAIAYVPSHLYHVMFELFKVKSWRIKKRSLTFDFLIKNAMRATVEFAEQKKSTQNLPPISVSQKNKKNKTKRFLFLFEFQVDVVKGKEDVTIRIR